MARISAWRVNDVVAYDVMRELATTLIALLLGSTPAGSSGADATRAEVAELRRSVLTVDGYDRAQVAAFASRIRNRISELPGELS